MTTFKKGDRVKVRIPEGERWFVEFVERVAKPDAVGTVHDILDEGRVLVNWKEYSDFGRAGIANVQATHLIHACFMDVRHD